MANDVPWYSGDVVEYIYGDESIKKIRSLTDFYPVRITSENLGAELPNLKEVEVIFSCWGILPLTEVQLDQPYKSRIRHILF